MKLCVDINFRDLQPIDLDDLGWTGGPAHQQVLRESLEVSWKGDVELLVGEVNQLRLVACGGIDSRRDPVAGELWMLIVDDAWRGLGIGTRLIAELEERARAKGLGWTRLAVEDDNPLARDLYERLGYRELTRKMTSWPSDDGSGVDVPVTIMMRSL